MKLLLLPRCTLRVFRPSNRQQRRSGNRKSEQCRIIQRSLSAWGDRDGFFELLISLFDQPLGDAPGGDAFVPESDNAGLGANVKQCLQKVADGHFTLWSKYYALQGLHLSVRIL